MRGADSDQYAFHDYLTLEAMRTQGAEEES